MYISRFSRKKKNVSTKNQVLQEKFFKVLKYSLFIILLADFNETRNKVSFNFVLLTFIKNYYFYENNLHTDGYIPH